MGVRIAAKSAVPGFLEGATLPLRPANAPVIVVPRGHNPRSLESGHLMFVLDDVVRAVAFNPDSLETSGDSEPILSCFGQRAGRPG